MFLTATTSPLALHSLSAADVLTRSKAYAQVGRLVRDISISGSSAAQAPKLAASPLQEDEKAYSFSLDLPGVGKEHLRIQIEDTVLRVETLEGAPRSYRAVYEFAHEIDSASSQARMEHGMLHLSLMKKLPVNKATELSIS
jgi:HSP20 family molecular chaperone IbpA